MTTPVLTNAVAGPFSLLYTAPSSSPVTLGMIGERGIREIERREGEDVAIDMLGGSAVDSVYRGGNCFLEFDLEEANYTGVQKLMHPWGITIGNEGEMGTPGMWASARCGILVATPILLTSAAAQTAPVRNYGLVHLAMGFDLQRLYASRRRTIPIRLRCYPYLNGGSPNIYVWYTKSAMP